MMIFTILASLLSGLPGMIGEYFKKKGEIEQASIDLQRQIVEAQSQLAMELAKADLQMRTAALQATGSKFKYFTFVMWFGPFVLGIVSPELSKQIFQNLAEMPDWYVQSCMTIMFTIWGISVSAPVVANIFNGLNTYLGERRGYKLQKVALDKKAYFDALRTIKGVVTDKDVAVGDKIVDLINQEK